jgi:ubiquinone/menaquinone biosynthesis C-methylase UbiE
MKTPPVIDYEGSDYQETFWDQGNRAYEDAAEEIALRRLLPPGNGHLLELGAGAGRNTHRYHGFEKITLLDYSTTQLQQAIKRLGISDKYRYVAANVYRLPFAPGVFSAATMIRMLHHLSEPLAALTQVNSCLFTNAVFILEFANKRNIKSILRYWRKKQDWDPFDREPVEFVKLNFDFHPKRVKEWMEEAHFTSEKQIAVSYLRSDLFKRTLPLSIMRLLEHLLQRSLSWAALSPSVFLKSSVSNDMKPANEGEYFRCPACGHHPLPDTPPLLTCGKCGQSYPVENGIYDFRLDR